MRIDAAGVVRDTKESVDALLTEFLEDQRRRLPSEAQMLMDDLVAAIEGGKRLRPIFCAAGYSAATGEIHARTIRAAASLELLHTFALLHDDAMDLHMTRRGKETTVSRAAARQRSAGGVQDLLHFGLSVSLLAGDLSFALSEVLLGESGFSPAVLGQARQHLDDMRLAAVSGQFADLVASGSPPAPELAARIARLKTAAYTCEGPLRFGAALGGGGHGLQYMLGRYGRALGEAFQLQNDLADLAFGRPDEARLGRPTSLVAEAATRADGPARELIATSWGKADAGDEEIEAVLEAIKGSGAVGSVRATVGRLVLEAKSALRDRSPLDANSPALVMLDFLADLVGGLDPEIREVGA